MIALSVNLLLVLVIPSPQVTDHYNTARREGRIVHSWELYDPYFFCPSHVGSFTYNDTIIQEITYYKNGNIRTIFLSHFDREGANYKIVYESFRKNGSQRSVHVLDHGIHILYHARFNELNQYIVERNYTYNAQGTLILTETIRDGVSKYSANTVDIFGNPVYEGE